MKTVEDLKMDDLLCRTYTNQQEIEHNKNLVERYPFLAPHVFENIDEDYDYSFTELDNVPDGWRKAFGIDLCEELRDALIRDNVLDDYYILEIKEKYGELRWYDNGGTKSTYDILSKYGDKSWDTCILCGKPSTKMTTGWVMPLCDDCVKDVRDNVVDIKRD